MQTKIVYSSYVCLNLVNIYRHHCKASKVYDDSNTDKVDNGAIKIGLGRSVNFRKEK